MQSKTLKVLTIVVCVILICGLAYFVMPTLLVGLAPFVIAYFLSLALEPLIRLLNEKMRLPRSIAACICTVLAVGIIGGFLTWVIWQLWTQVIELADKWPELYAASRDYLTEAFAGWSGYYDSLSPQVQSYIDYGVEEARSGLTSLISPVANRLVAFARGLVAGVPSAIIFVIVTFLACNFMCSEKKKLRALFARVFGMKVLTRISNVWHDLKSALGGYVKAQLSIMCVSCVILLIGFSIAGVPFSLLLAFVVAFLDALPVFGSGLVLIPWSLVSLLQQDYATMAIMLVMYITIIITRQILEPRILGKQIGVPPLLTLMSMYIGLKTIGIFGMIVGPVLVLIVKNLYVGGVFDHWLKTEEKIEKKEESNPEKEVQDHE